MNQDLGFSGSGVRIGIIDTGVDYRHPALGGCFGAGCKVEFGYDLVGDDFDGSPSSVAQPDPDPQDCDGHGTHVAGVAGGLASRGLPCACACVSGCCVAGCSASAPSPSLPTGVFHAHILNMSLQLHTQGRTAHNAYASQASMLRSLTTSVSVQRAAGQSLG